jgi:hypothetical protein
LGIIEPTQLAVYNMAGQKLKVMTVNSDPEVIQVLDVSKFSAGSYFLSVKNSRYEKSIPFIINR